MRNNFKDTKHLFLDLFRLGDYSKWINPKNIYNLEWFNNKNTVDFQNEDILIERIKSLLDLGLDLSDKAYLVANVNKPKILKFVLENGANLYHPNSNNLLLRAASRKRTKIIDIIISSNQFIPTSNDILYLSSNLKYKQLSVILQKNNELFFSEEQHLIMHYCCSNILNNKDGRKFLNELLSKSIEKEKYYSIHNIYKNSSIIQKNKELAKIIIEKNNSLFSDLAKKPNNNSSFKL